MSRVTGVRRVTRLAGMTRVLVAIALWVTLPAAWAGAQEAAGRITRHADAARNAQRAGDFATAIKEYTALARLLPERADVQSNLGVAYFFNQQPREALAAFDKALRLDRGLVSALIFSGIAQHTLSRPARAIPLLERAVALSPADPLAHTWLAHSYAAQGRFEQARDHFLIATERSPRDVDVWYGLGRVYVQLGRQAVTRLATIAPDGARIAQLSGDLWLLRGAPDNALPLYQEALKRRPDLVEVQQIVERLRSRAAAPSPGDLQPPRPALGAAPSPEDAQYAAATECRERAQHAFERISTLDADSYRAHQVLAESLEAQERVDEAIAEYRTVLAQKPDLAGVYLAIGNLLMSEGRAAQAVDAYRHELRVRPESAEVHYRLARAFLVLGHTTEAQAALTRTLALDAPPPAAQRELGKLHLTRGDPAAAVKALSSYVATVTNDAAGHYLLMQAYRAIGDAPAADRQFAIYDRLAAREKQAASLEGALSLFSGSEPPPEL